MVAPLRPFGRPVHVQERDGKLEVDMELHEGMELDREKCETCDAKEGCIIFQLVFGDKEEEAGEGSEKSDEGEDTEKEETSEEQAADDANDGEETSDAMSDEKGKA